MSNADNARAAWEAYIAAGLDAEAGRPYFTDDCVYEDPPEAPDSRAWSDLAEYTANFAAMWDSYTLELRETADVAPDLAMAVLSVKGFPAGATVAMDAELVFLSHYRGDKVCRHRCFLSRDAALAAAAQSATSVP